MEVALLQDLLRGVRSATIEPNVKLLSGRGYRTYFRYYWKILSILSVHIVEGLVFCDLYSEEHRMTNFTTLEFH